LDEHGRKVEEDDQIKSVAADFIRSCWGQVLSSLMRARLRGLRI
jgi:hypothetical protein